MNAQQARRRREAARVRQADRRRRARRRRLGIAAVLALALVAGIGALAFSVAHRDRQPATGPGPLAGLQTGPAPWSADTAGLAERLQAIGVPPLSPMEGTAVHTHQHLDLYVDGRKVTVPAGIGIDPAVGYAPLHTHDASGVIHVESPTARSYTLGELFAVWGVRFTPSCLGGYCAAGGRQLRVYVDGRAYRGDPPPRPWRPTRSWWSPSARPLSCPPQSRPPTGSRLGCSQRPEAALLATGVALAGRPDAGVVDERVEPLVVRQDLVASARTSSREARSAWS